MNPRRIVLVAIGVFCMWSVILIAQHPGLYYDEALLAAGAVHMQHSAGEFDLAHAPHTWVCKFRYCLPLMAEGRYIGAIKEYISLPFFAVFGSRVALIRCISMMLGLFGIWGLSNLVSRQAGQWAGAALALILALNPAYISMTVFDNGAVSAMMAALGLVCTATARYLDRKNVAAAFFLGFAAGFSVWTRANFVWTLVAAVGAAFIARRGRLFAPFSHWVAIGLGGLIGGLPFLVYQVLSRGGTLDALNMFIEAEPLQRRLLIRLVLLSETLLSDREHRAMWGAASMPEWQRWLFPLIVVAACALCLSFKRPPEQSRWPFAQFMALTFLFLGAFLFLTRVEVSEHHLIAMLPFAAATVVLACVILQARYPHGWTLSAALALVYLGSTLYWQLSTIQGLRETGGVGPWSNAGLELARYIEQEHPGQELKILEWGYQQNLYVLTNGRIEAKEIFWEATDQVSGDHLPWIDEVRQGGLFLVSGPENHQVPGASSDFLRVLSATRPAFRSHSVTQRNGSTYAQLIEIEPNSNRGPGAAADEFGTTVSLGEARSEGQFTGFYEIESTGWRWSKPEFSFTLKAPDYVGGRPWLLVQLFVPEISIQTLGPLTLMARVGDNILPPQIYARPGSYSFRRELSEEWFRNGPTRIDFSLDKWLPPTSADRRKLGIIVVSASIFAR